MKKVVSIVLIWYIFFNFTSRKAMRPSRLTWQQRKKQQQLKKQQLKKQQLKRLQKRNKLLKSYFLFLRFI
jgi:hypothetical protein